MTTETVILELSRAEALVLFEWLAREDSRGPIAVDDPSERDVLWMLEGKLESILTEPLAPNYRELLAEAREKVRDKSS